LTYYEHFCALLTRANWAASRSNAVTQALYVNTAAHTVAGAWFLIHGIVCLTALWHTFNNTAAYDMTRFGRGDANLLFTSLALVLPAPLTVMARP